MYAQATYLTLNFSRTNYQSQQNKIGKYDFRRLWTTPPFWPLTASSMTYHNSPALRILEQFHAFGGRRFQIMAEQWLESQARPTQENCHKKMSVAKIRYVSLIAVTLAVVK